MPVGDFPPNICFHDAVGWYTPAEPPQTDGVWIRVIELHGVCGGKEWTVEKEPFFMLIERK